MNRNFEDRKSRKVCIKSNENKAIIKALDLYGRVPEQYELLEEIKRLNNIKQDLLYVLSQLDGYLDKNWTIDLNFTDIREKYKKDIEDYENWN